MGVQVDAIGNLCARIGASALSNVEVLSRLIARIETLDASLNAVAVSYGAPLRLRCPR
jgi:hypothetical protein